MRMSMRFKRLVVGVLSVALSLSGCGNAPRTDAMGSVSSTATSTAVTSATQSPNFDGFQTADIEFTGMSDPNLCRYLQDAVYNMVVSELDTDEYYVENVETAYVSKDYLEELAYNTQSNVYFGYTLAELEDCFQETRYVFTLDEDTGQTVVRAFEGHDDSFNQVVRNIAIGSGVILVCVTISTVTGGAGFPAASMIFAVSAKTGAIAALSGGTISGAAAGIITGLQTGDMDEALKAAAINGSEGFMWGAIGGAITGGAGEAVALHGATAGGLSINEVAAIQRESKLPLDVIRQLNNMEQYEILKDAGLYTYEVGGRAALIRNIDLDFVDELGRTNLQRMQQGLAALDPATGKAYELHHVGQQVDSTLAILTQEEHRLGDSYKIWHLLSESDVDHGAAWATQKKEFWQALAALQG